MNFIIIECSLVTTVHVHVSCYDIFSEIKRKFSYFYEASEKRDFGLLVNLGISFSGDVSDSINKAINHI